MLGASVSLLALVSTFVAFGSWPGTASGTAVDQIVLRSVTAAHKASPVTVASAAHQPAARNARRAARSASCQRPQ